MPRTLVWIRNPDGSYRSVWMPGRRKAVDRRLAEVLKGAWDDYAPLVKSKGTTTMNDDDVTELDELTAEKVSGVQKPANGTPWLLLKASDTYQSDASRQQTPKSNLPRAGKGKTKLPPGVDSKWAGKPASPKSWKAGRWPTDPQNLAQDYSDRLGTGPGDVLPAPVGTDQRAQIASVRKQVDDIGQNVKALRQLAKSAKTPAERDAATRSLAAALSLEAMIKSKAYGNGGYVTPGHTARVAANDVGVINDGTEPRFVNAKAKKPGKKVKLAKQGNGGYVTPKLNVGGTLPDIAGRIQSPRGEYRNKKGKLPKKYRQGDAWSDADGVGVSALKEIDTLGRQLKKAKALGDPIEIDRLSQQLTLQQLRFRHLVQTPSLIPPQPATVTKTADDRLSRLQKSMDKITDRLATNLDGLSPIRIAELRQTQRQLASELLLERLKMAHRAGRI